MSTAKNMKLKEYGTAITVHEEHTVDAGVRVRPNNTFKSTIMEQMPQSQDNYHNKSRERQ